MANEVIKFEASSGTVELSSQIVRQYLVSGNGKVSDQEIMMFLKLCQYQKLNPFLREVYLIKYSDSASVSMVTGIETFRKRAVQNANYRGHQTGISDDGKVAWCEVHVDGYVLPIRVEVDLYEYQGKKADGTITKMWAEKPRTMLKKVAEAQGLRTAFPDCFAGLYSAEEMSYIDMTALPTGEVNMTPSKTSTVKEKPDDVQPIPESETPAEAATESQKDKKVTPAQAKWLYATAMAANNKNTGLLVAWLKDNYGVTNTADVLATDFEMVKSYVSKPLIVN